MPMMPYEPILQASSVGLPEVTGIAALAGVVVAGSFGLVALERKYIAQERKDAAQERREERQVREREAEAKLRLAEVTEKTLSTLQQLIKTGGP